MTAQFNFVSPRERILYLKSIPYLSGLSSQQLLPLAEKALERSFRTGEHLIRPDQPVPAAQLIVSGQVDLRWDNRKVLDVEPPHGIGFLGMLAGVERGIEAVASQPTQTLEISANDLLRVYERNFKLLSAVVGAMVDEIIERRAGYPADPKNPPEATAGDRRGGTMSFVERLLSYRRIELFRRANLDAISELVQQQSERRWKAGEVIWRAGEVATFDLWIDYGVVECDPDDGRPPMDIGHDYTLGMETLAQRPRAYTARAKTDIIGLTTHADVYYALLEDHPGLAMSVATSIARLLVSVRGSAVMDPPTLPFTDRAVGDLYSVTAPRTVI